MKIHHLKTIVSSSLYICLFSVLISACKKTDNSCPTSFKVTASSLTPTVGETLILSASVQGYHYVWNGPLNFHEVQTSGGSSISIDNIKINQSGWWFGSLTGTGCSVLVDSVFIDVKYKQGNPPCSLTDNKVTGTGLPDLQASSVRKYYDLSRKGMTLYGSGTFGYPTYSFLFNSYNGQSEPKDGFYVTKDVQSFSPFDDANVIYGQCQYGSYFFKTQPGQTIYVSHVSGKLRVAFCGLQMSGDNGNSVMITSAFSGQVTEN